MTMAHKLSILPVAHMGVSLFGPIPTPCFCNFVAPFRLASKGSQKETNHAPFFVWGGGPIVLTGDH